MRIVTWNVAGGRTVLSRRQFDYAREENRAYFVSQLAALQPDIVCLQEAHGNDQYSLAATMALELGLPYVFEVPTCPSHIDSRYKLCNAIISKLQFAATHSYLLPHPSFQLYLHGKPVPAFDRYLVLVTISGYMVATLHVEPLSILGYNYSNGPGLAFAGEIDTLLRNSLAKPLIFTADLYSETITRTFPRLMRELSLLDVLPKQLPTTPQGDQPDHILCTPDWRIIDSKIIVTDTDHYLCYADVELN